MESLPPGAEPFNPYQAWFFSGVCVFSIIGIRLYLTHVATSQYEDIDKLKTYAYKRWVYEADKKKGALQT